MSLFSSKPPDMRSRAQKARDYFNENYSTVRGGSRFEYSMFHAHYVEMDMLDKLHQQISDLQKQIETLNRKIDSLENKKVE